MPTNRKTKSEESDILLEGRQTISVQFEDDGKPDETVTLKRIGFSKTRDFFQVSDNPVKQVLMCLVNKSGSNYNEEWIESLKEESFFKLASTTTLINENVLKKSLILQKSTADLMGDHLPIEDADPKRGKAELLKMAK